MMNISCDIVRDLLMLYTDDVCSEKSKEAVEEHMKECAGCREFYENLKEPVKVDTLTDNYVKVNKNPFLKIRRKNFINALSAIIVTVAVMIVGVYIVQEVGVVHEFFCPMKRADITVDDNSSDWIRVSVDESEYISFDSLFFRKNITNSANSEGDVELRIKDTDGNILVDNISIKAGRHYECELKRFENYIVEVKADDGRYFINFW